MMEHFVFSAFPTLRNHDSQLVQRLTDMKLLGELEYFDRIYEMRKRRPALCKEEMHICHCSPYAYASHREDLAR
jgi:hypothetical protein